MFGSFTVFCVFLSLSSSSLVVINSASDLLENSTLKWDVKLTHDPTIE